jgi:hypothetical protein
MAAFTPWNRLGNDTLRIAQMTSMTRYETLVSARSTSEPTLSEAARAYSGRSFPPLHSVYPVGHLRLTAEDQTDRRAFLNRMSAPLSITDGAFMEPSGRNQWQPVAKRTAAKRHKQAKTVAVGCDRLPIGSHGKEGVDGSSPSEGSAKMPQIGPFPFRLTCMISSVRRVWSRLWSFQIRELLEVRHPDLGALPEREQSRPPGPSSATT